MEAPNHPTPNTGSEVVSLEQERRGAGRAMEGDGRAMDDYSDLPPVRRRRGSGRAAHGGEHPQLRGRQETAAGTTFSGLRDDGNWTPHQVRQQPSASCECEGLPGVAKQVFDSATLGFKRQVEVVLLWVYYQNCSSVLIETNHLTIATPVLWFLYEFVQYQRKQYPLPSTSSALNDPVNLD